MHNGIINFKLHAKMEKKIKELKPCPFCGGDAKIFDMGCDYFVVCCERDTCLGNVRADEGFYCDIANISDGIEVWNTRHLSQTSIKEYCNLCGHEVIECDIFCEVCNERRFINKG